MLQRILNIIKYPYVVPKRIDRINLANKLLINYIVLYLLIFVIFMLGIKIEGILGNNFAEEFVQLKSFFLMVVSFPYILLCIITVWRLFVARLHDFNSSGFWSLFLLIPLLNIFFKIFLLVKSGTKGENKFGKQGILTNKVSIVFGIISIIVTIFLTLFFFLANLVIFLMN